MSTTVVLVGYAQRVILSLLVLPQFEQLYGDVVYPHHHRSIPASWNLALQIATVASSAVGTLIAGALAARVSPRRLVVFALVSYLALGTIPLATPPSRAAFVAGVALQGIPLGLFGPLATSYASDVLPRAVADLLTAHVCACWVVGQVLASAALWASAAAGGKEGYDRRCWAVRAPLAPAWAAAPALAAACCFAPESPVFLARRGRRSEALAALRRLAPLTPAADADVAARERLDAIDEVIRTEEAMRIGPAYADCFRGSNRRRTEIAVICYAGQLLSGFGIANQVVYFLHLTGLDMRESFRVGFCGLAPAPLT